MTSTMNDHSSQSELNAEPELITGIATNTPAYEALGETVEMEAID